MIYEAYVQMGGLSGRMPGVRKAELLRRHRAGLSDEAIDPMTGRRFDELMATGRSRPHRPPVVPEVERFRQALAQRDGCALEALKDARENLKNFGLAQFRRELHELRWPRR